MNCHASKDLYNILIIISFGLEQKLPEETNRKPIREIQFGEFVSLSTARGRRNGNNKQLTALTWISKR